MSDQSSERDVAIQIVQKLREAGYQSVWAGGCVRDELMQREPKDYDVATNATPDQIRKVFGHRSTLPIGAAFGVITVIDRKTRCQIEVATFRNDGDYSDGRRPDSVSFSNMEEDAQRRDFTINGLFYDPVDEKVIDFVGGQDDIQHKVIRAIGDPHLRIGEDKLRMLRAVRFAATFGFAIESSTRQALNEHSAEIEVVSAERIASEMRLMLAHPNRSIAMKLLRETGLLVEILPESTAMGKDQFDTLQRQLDAINTRVRSSSANDVFIVGLCLILCAMSSDEAVWQTICRRWKLSNEEKDRSIWLARNISTILNANDQPWPLVQRVLVAADTLLLVDVAGIFQESDRAGEIPNAGIEFCRERLSWPPERLNPAPLIDGNDLIQSNVKPGKQFSRLLKACRDAQLLGEISTKDEAIEFARNLVQSM